MKHYFLSVAACVGLLATSCQNDEPQMATSGEGMTFSVSVPAQMKTRAYADGKTATKLMAYAYDTSNGTSAAPVATKEATLSNLKATVSFDLITGRKYDIVFLATAPENSGIAYTASNRTFTVTYGNGNNENLDAFYAVVPGQVCAGSSEQTVLLNRAFAQLNIGTSDLSKYLELRGKENLTNVAVTVKGLYNTFSLMDGDVTGNGDVEVTFEGLPSTTENFPVTFKAGDKETSFNYLAMNYLLVPSDRSLVDISMKVEDETYVHSYPNVPVRKNYRTNIYGKLLTNGSDYNVEIKPGFTGEEGIFIWEGKEVKEPVLDTTDDNTYLITEASELTWIAYQCNTLGADGNYNSFEGKTVKLDSDLDLSGIDWSPIGEFVNGVSSQPFKGTFDGNNHSISNLNVNVTKYKQSAGLFGDIQAGTVKDLTLTKPVVKGTAYTGAIAGRIIKGASPNYWVTLQNVTVDGANITSEPAKDKNGIYDGGNNVGGMIGLTQFGVDITNCKVINSTIQGYAKVGGFAGLACYDASQANHTIWTNNTVENCNVVQDTRINYESATPTTIGAFYGMISNASALVESNTTNNVTVSAFVAEGVSFDETNATYSISGADGLQWVADQVNGTTRAASNTFSGQTIKLTSDIDLAGIDWTPIGATMAHNPTVAFRGTLDGNGYTISNLKVRNSIENYSASGLIGCLIGKVQNLTLKNVDIIGTHYVGGIAGYVDNETGSIIENCHVIGGTLVSNVEFVNNEYDNGDKVGGILGYGCIGSDKVRNCSVENLTISGYRHFASIVGYANSLANVENNTAKNIILKWNKPSEGQDYKNFISNNIQYPYGTVVCTGTNYTEGIFTDLGTNTVENVIFQAEGK